MKKMKNTKKREILPTEFEFENRAWWHEKIDSDSVTNFRETWLANINDGCFL